MKDEILRILAATGLTGLLGKSIYDYVRNKNTLVKIKVCEQHREVINNKLNSTALDINTIKAKEEEKHTTISNTFKEYREDLKDIKKELKEISLAVAKLIPKE